MILFINEITFASYLPKFGREWTFQCLPVVAFNVLVPFWRFFSPAPPSPFLSNPNIFPSHHQQSPWDCSTGMPSTDSDSEYLDAPDGDSDSEVHGAVASDVTPRNTRKKRRLRHDDDIINGIKPEANDIALMSPFLSIIGMMPAQYEPLVCPIIPSLSTFFDFNFDQGYNWHQLSCMPGTNQKWMALC